MAMEADLCFSIRGFNCGLQSESFGFASEEERLVG